MNRLFLILLTLSFIGCTPPIEVIKPDGTKEKGAIRYDKTPELPGGYFEYCNKYPLRTECGSKK